MKHAFQIIDHLSRWLVGLAFFGIIVAVVIQLVGRNILSDSPVWTEELSRFGLLYMVAFGLGPSLQSGDLVNVDLFCENLSGRKPWILRLVSAILMAGLCLVLLPSAWQFTAIGALQHAPALGWRMDFVHVTMLLTLISLLIYSLVRIIGMLAGTTTGLPDYALGESEEK